MTSTTLYHRIGQNCFTVISLLALLFLTTDTAFSQGWLRHYPLISNSNNGAEPNQLVIATNGDFVVAGTGYLNNYTECRLYLERFDASGGPIWSKTINFGVQQSNPFATLYFLEKCPGGGFVLGGSGTIGGDARAFMYKVSESGDSIWAFYPNLNTFGFLNSVAASPDGNLLVGGTQKVGLPGQELQTPFLFKINALDGSLIWSKAYTEHQLPEYGASVMYAPDGSILETGNSNDSVFIRQLDANGNLFRVIGMKAIGTQYPVLIRAASDGFSWMYHEATNNDIWFRKYDYNGNLLNATTTSNSIFLIDDGTETSNGFAFTIMPLQGSGAYRPALYKMDFNGNISAPTYPMEDFSIGGEYNVQNVKTTPDGGLLFVGAKEVAATAYFALKTDSTGHLDPAVILGNVFRDEDLDCNKSVSESNLFPVLVQATDLSLGTQWYETTDSSGNFALVVGTGDYEIEPLAPVGTAGYWQACPPQLAMLTIPNDTVTLDPLGLKPLVQCPFLQLDFGAGLMRPCSTTVLNVNVLNAGTSDADSAMVWIEVDPALTFESSTVPLIAQNGNQFWFNAGPVAALQSVQFSINFGVDCSAQMGQVLCFDGHVSPDSLCAPLDTLWDRAILKLNAFCDGDSVKFQVINLGEGDMNQASELVIIEDYIILFSVPIQLMSGQDTLITLVNPNGQTYYGRIRQTEGFPGDAFASDGKDFCDGNGSSGMLLQYPLFAGGPFDARFCDEVRTSFDPNDKRGLPLGYGSTHYIDRGVPIDYRIRFQNTGNDTAFNITVLDTLPEFLDVASLRLGSASHDFTWKLSGNGVLAFHFANILLPDSSTNEPLSHGFVNFKLLPKSNIPAGTLIQNRAAIYFDYNAPVFTDYAKHTVDSNFIPTLSVSVPQTTQRISLLPNPANESTTLNLETLVAEGGFPLLLTLTDVLGKTLRQESVLGPNHILQRGNLPAGLCILKLEHENGVVLAVGKVVWGL